jgi:Carboxypeptidase regulatory-like domain
VGAKAVLECRDKRCRDEMNRAKTALWPTLLDWHFGVSLFAIALSISAPSVLAQGIPASPVVTQMPDNTDRASITATGTIIGTIVDKDGAVISNAKVALTAGPFTTQMQSGDNGAFTFTDVPAGPFQVAVSAPGFADQTQAGVLAAGQEFIVPEVQLVVATTVEVQVTQTRDEIAAEEVRVEERQRVFGVIPNYYVSYVPEPVPLSTRQKFHLGWKFTIDPVSIAFAGVFAGAQQASDSHSGYGQGAQGYAKRFGAAYTDFVTGVFFGNMVFPALLKQDPRYFYKGTGSKKSRFFYAVANAVICKGDNGHWQPNYSSILGSLTSGGISNLYYPASDRGIGLTFENTLIGIGGSAGSAVIQEFFLKKVTSHSHNPQQ